MNTTADRTAEIDAICIALGLEPTPLAVLDAPEEIQREFWERVRSLPE